MKKKLLAIVSLVLAVSLLIVIGVVAEDAVKPKVFELRVVHDHPGLPGYDLKLDFVALYGIEGDMDRVNQSDFILSCDVKEVEIGEGYIVIPASFKDTTDLQGFKVYGKHKDDPETVGYYPIALKKWDLVVEDKFDGDAVDTEKWTVAASGDRQDVGNGAIWEIDDSTVTVEDGKMVMRVLRNDGTADTDATFLAPSVYSKFTQNEGLFMTTMKLPTQGGCNTAFWSVPTTGGWGQEFFVRGRSGKNEGYLDGEFDIVEYSPNWKKNGVPYFECTDHWWNELTLERREPGSNVKYPYANLQGEYVNFALAWTPTALYYYCDGNLVKSVKNIENTGEPMRIRYTIQEGSYKNADPKKWAGAFYDEDIPYMVAYVDDFAMYK